MIKWLKYKVAQAMNALGLAPEPCDVDWYSVDLDEFHECRLHEGHDSPHKCLCGRIYP